MLPPSSTRNARMSVAAVAMENIIPRVPSRSRAFRPSYNIDKSIKQYHLEFKSSKCTENKHGLCNWSCKLHPIYEDLWDVIIMHPLMQVCIKGNGVLHAEHLSCWDSRSSNDKLTLGYNLQTVHLVH